MKKFNFNPNVLTAGVALALGVGIASGVSASTSSGSASPSNGIQISNTATASYSVDSVAQPTVTSNAVIVNVSEIGSFTLYGTQGTSTTDDKNENQAAVPGGTTSFTNKLTNTGNVTDTYTLNLTTNNDTNITTGNQDYQFTSPTPITYVIKNADNSTPTAAQLAAGQPQTGTVSASNGTIKLLPGQYADLTYNVTSPTTVTGGQSGVGTLTATSSYITSNTTAGATATLVNENQAIVKLPVFAITKTATNTNINLNTTNPTIDYTITVTNDGTATYAADAIGVLIQDKLPTGLTVLGGASAITVTSTDSTTSNGTAPTVTTLNGRQLIAINGVALKVNETMTIKFTAAINRATVNKAGVTNTAEVYDNYANTPVTSGDNPTADIKDSSGTSNPTDAKVPNDPMGTGTGGDTSTTINFSYRSLTFTGDASAELPPKSTPNGVTYTQTITNTGNSPETGLTFTISNPSATDNITPRNVIYTPQGGTAVTLTADANGVYTIPGSLAAGATGTITYDVVTTEAAIGTSETNEITLIPAAVTGTTTPIVPSVENTTTVRGMTLVKEQALDATCDKTPDTAFAQTPVTAIPGQCIVYKITATNTMTTRQLTNVVISDKADQWNTKATYVAGSIFDSAGGTTVAPGAIAQSSALSLAPGTNGYLQFVIRINNAN